jgi:hypothetical protein
VLATTTFTVFSATLEAMRSYPHTAPSSQSDSAIWQQKPMEIPPAGRGDHVASGPRSSRRQTGNPYSRQLFRHLIATTLLAAVTVLFWLSLIGLAPGASATTLS